MKRIMTLQTGMMIVLLAAGQGISSNSSWGGLGQSYIPYHQYLQQQSTGLQSSTTGMMNMVYKQVAYRQDSWDMNTNEFGYSDSGLFVYTNQGWVTSYTTYNFTQGDWGNYYKLTYTYDASGNQLSYLNQYWNSNSDTWINVSVFTNTYDASNHMLTAMTQVWDTAALAWLNVQNYIYAYDSYGNKIQQTSQTWDAINKVWVNNYQTLNSYDANNRLTAVLNQQSTVGGGWGNATQTLNTYDNSGNLLTQTAQVWNSGAWVNNSMITTSYNANKNVTSVLGQNWQNGAWSNSTMTSNSFDSNYNQIQQMGLLWNGQTNVWDTTTLNLYTYNSANKILTETDQLNSPAGFVNMNKYIYTYDAENNNTEYQSFQSIGKAWGPVAVYQYGYDKNGNPVSEEYQSYNLQTSSFQPVNQYTFYYKSFEAPSEPSAINAISRNDFGATIYPNPSSGPTVHVDLTVDASESIVMNVYDMNGRLVNSGFMPLASGSQSIELGSSDLADGTYFVQLIERNGDKTSVLPFVKQ